MRSFTSKMSPLFFSVLCYSIFRVKCAILGLSDFFDIGTNQDFRGETNESPTILTSLLDLGMSPSMIQRYARVPSFVNETRVESFAGFLTVNKNFNSHLYFWFCPSENNPSEDPLVLWLQGGPGDTFFSSFFNGNGPYTLSDYIQKSNTSWTSNYNMIYIENPIGAGYSFTESSAGYSKTVEEASENMYIALVQFFQIFPHLKQNDIYIAGESFAGKFAPAIAIYLQKQNKYNPTVQFRIKGLFIGCGFMDPVNQLYFADYFHQLGIIDEKTKKETEETERNIREDLQEGNYYTAEARLVYLLWTSASLGHMPPIDAISMKIDYSFYSKMRSLILSEEFRAAANLGNAEFHGKVQVWWNFKQDILKSVSHYISEALREFKVLLYAGQFDLLIPPIQIEKVIANLDFPHMDKFYNSRRRIWYVDDEIAGYTKHFGNLSSAVVRKSNHFILHSQPEWIKDLFNRFVNDDW